MLQLIHSRASVLLSGQTSCSSIVVLLIVEAHFIDWSCNILTRLIQMLFATFCQYGLNILSVLRYIYYKIITRKVVFESSRSQFKYLFDYTLLFYSNTSFTRRVYYLSIKSLLITIVILKIIVIICIALFVLNRIKLNKI